MALAALDPERGREHRAGDHALWNSPCSPARDRLAAAARRAGASSNSAPISSRGMTRGSSVEMRARMPPAIISRASAGVGSPQSGKSGVSPVPASRSSRYSDVLEEQIAERDVREAVGDGAARTAAPQARLSRSRSCRATAEESSRAAGPAASACARRISSRTPCIDTRPAVAVQRRQQRADGRALLAAACVQRPRAVLAAAPGQEASSFAIASGRRIRLNASDAARRSQRPSTTRGPGITMRSSKRKSTRMVADGRDRAERRSSTSARPRARPTATRCSPRGPRG